MKVAVVNRHDIKGGAARAAFRIFDALHKNGMGVTMLVNSAESDHSDVHNRFNKRLRWVPVVRNMIGTGLARLILWRKEGTLSPALLSSSLAGELNHSTYDVINLHWVNGEMLSIADLAKIKKPVVWTLHDMWAFSGAEHYSEHMRWKEGYLAENRSEDDKGRDLNRWVWERKKKYWKKPFHIVTPSNWLAECVKNSALMKGWPVSVIHNAIDTDFWRPLNKKQARLALNIAEHKKVVMFGAIGGGKDPRKGFELLLQAFNNLEGKINNLWLIVVGQNPPENYPEIGFPLYFTGHVSSEEKLREIYNAADLLVIPSRQDNLPNMGVEALACGTPVVAFNTCGLPDLVQHRRTGYLANAFDCDDLAAGIEWVLGCLSHSGKEHARYTALEQQCRDYALKNFSYDVVADKYAALFTTLIDNDRHSAA